MPRAFERVALLTVPGTTSRLVAQALAAEGVLRKIVIVGRPPRARRLRARARHRGWLGLGSYLACATASVALYRLRGGPARAQEIVAQIGLPDAWPDSVPRVHVSDVNAADCVDELRGTTPDLVVVNGTPIIRRPVLDAVPVPFVNVHVGLTPDYRGADGGFWAIANGELDRIGVTIHHVDEGVDTGGVIAQATVRHDPARDGLRTLPLLQYQAALPLLREFVRTGAGPGPVPGSRRSGRYRSPGLPPYLRVLLGARLRH